MISSNNSSIKRRVKTLVAAEMAKPLESLD